MKSTLKNWGRTVGTVAMLATATVVLVACPKQGAHTEASGEQEASPPENSRYKGTTRDFVQALARSTALKYTVTDEGAAVVYEEVNFSEDGGFKAQATIRLGDEPFECQEAGNWAIEGEASTSRSNAVLVFQMTTTNCAGREAPMSWRARTQIDGTDIELSHI